MRLYFSASCTSCRVLLELQFLEMRTIWRFRRMITASCHIYYVDLKGLKFPPDWVTGPTSYKLVSFGRKNQSLKWRTKKGVAVKIHQALWTKTFTQLCAIKNQHLKFLFQIINFPLACAIPSPDFPYLVLHQNNLHFTASLVSYQPIHDLQCTVVNI